MKKINRLWTLALAALLALAPCLGALAEDAAPKAIPETDEVFSEPLEETPEEDELDLGELAEPVEAFDAESELPLGAWAEDGAPAVSPADGDCIGEEGGSYDFVYEGGSLKLRWVDHSVTAFTVPSEYQGIQVTGIATAFHSCTSLTSVSIPEGITTIGDGAFYGCSALTEITLPSTLKSIGIQAFSDCTSLKAINLPEGLTSIGDSAFYGCSSLTEVILPSTLTEVGSCAFYCCPAESGLVLPGQQVGDDTDDDNGDDNGDDNSDDNGDDNGDDNDDDNGDDNSDNNGDDNEDDNEEDSKISIPDAALKAYIFKTFDTNGSGVLSKDESDAVTSIDVSDDNIKSLKGLTQFQHLQNVKITSKGLTNVEIGPESDGEVDYPFTAKSVDLSGCTSLKKVEVSNCKDLTSLNLTNCTSMTKIDLEDTYLSSLTLTGCTGLTALELEGTYLSSLTLMGCTGLKHLSLVRNKFVQLRLTGLPKLERLQCVEPALKELDVSGCTALKDLSVDESDIPDSGDPAAANLELLNVSSCTALKVLSCARQRLTSLDVSGCTALEELRCAGNSLKSLTLGKLPNLKELLCDGNPLGSLDVRAYTALETLWCGECKLTKLDISKNTKLNDLDCHGNALTTLNVSANKSLDWLNCSNNKLTALNVSKLKNMSNLKCQKNKLSKLDVSNSPRLDTLYCDDNQLTALDLSKNKNMEHLTCGNNQLKTLKLSKNTKLESLSCENNRLTALDLSKHKKLSDLNCSGNRIGSLMLQSDALHNVDCSYNQLKRASILINDGTFSFTGNPLAIVDMTISKSKDMIDSKAFKSILANSKKTSYQASGSSVRLSIYDKTEEYSLYFNLYFPIGTIVRFNSGVIYPTVKSLSLDKSITLGIGGTQALKPKITLSSSSKNMDYAVACTWKSDNPKFVTVDKNGVVTAVRRGSAKVVATAPDGKKAECTVNVVDSVKPEKVTIVQGKSATLELGSALELQTRLSPEGATGKATWKSGNTKVATVDKNGVVTPLKAGTAKITATAKKGVTATITVKVVAPKADGITITYNSAKTFSDGFRSGPWLNAGETLKLKVAPVPDYAKIPKITWSSSDTSIATVDANGVVTGKGSGTITITATAANGVSNNVWVKSSGLDPTAIRITCDTDTSNIQLNTKKLELKVSYVPSKAKKLKLTWTSSNPKVATIRSKGTVAIVYCRAVGTATITATASNGVSASINVTVVAGGKKKTK